jgi:hypothetical protein
MGGPIGYQSEANDRANRAQARTGDKFMTWQELDTLYPEAAARLQVGAMSSPRRPGELTAGRPGASARDFYGANLIWESVAPEPDRIAVIDKAFPHAQHEVMLLASGEPSATSVSDLSSAARSRIFCGATTFVDFVDEVDVRRRFGLDDGLLHASFNFDRDTTDRENSMFFDKRFHLHLNYFSATDLRGVERAHWTQLPRPFARRLIDPLAYIAEHVFADANQFRGDQLPLLRVDVDRDVAAGWAPGPKLVLANWRQVGSTTTQDLLVRAHDLAQWTYDEVRTVFCGDSAVTAPWTRPRLLPSSEIRRRAVAARWLGEDSRRGLEVLAKSLCDTTGGSIAALRAHPARQVGALTLAGLDYSLSMHSPRQVGSGSWGEQPVLLTWSFKLFGDIGGAGLPPAGGCAAVKLDRATGPIMTHESMMQRRSFQEDFVARLV